jgi:hypothetical protein
MQIIPTIVLTNVPKAEQAAFTAAVNAACSFYDNLFSNNVTLNITFKMGTLPSGQGATNYPTYQYTTFAAVENALALNAQSPVAKTALATLKSTDPSDPTHGGTFWVSNAQLKAWNLSSAQLQAAGLNAPGSFDGTVTLSNSSNVFLDNNTSRASLNQYDAVGELEHEISEVMGRFSIEGTAPVTFNQNNDTYTALDLFR